MVWLVSEATGSETGRAYGRWNPGNAEAPLPPAEGLPLGKDRSRHDGGALSDGSWRVHVIKKNFSGPVPFQTPDEHIEVSIGLDLAPFLGVKSGLVPGKRNWAASMAL